MLEKIDWVCHWNFHFKKHKKKDVIHAKIMQPKLNRYDFWWFVLLCNILHNILYYMCHFLVYFASLVGFIFNFRTGPRFVPGRPCMSHPSGRRTRTPTYGTSAPYVRRGTACRMGSGHATRINAPENLRVLGRMDHPVRLFPWLISCLKTAGQRQRLRILFRCYV